MQSTLENYLEAADGAGKLLVHARLLMKLTHLYQEIAPTHLGQASCVANYRSGAIVIHATSGAVATKLRQLAPTLVSEFSKQGVECTEVVVKVQAKEMQKQSRASTQKPLSLRTSNELGCLAGSLPASSLRSALESLLAKSARRE